MRRFFAGYRKDRHTKPY